MEDIISFIQSIDFENFDFLAILNSLIGIIKELLGGFIGDSGEIKL